MEFIKKIENLEFITNFKRKLRKKDYKNSTYISKEMAELFYQIIRTSIEEKNIVYQAELILLVAYLGKIFIAIDPVQFCIGNTIKRILHIIRDEINESKEEDKTDLEIKQEILAEKLKEVTKNFKGLKNFDFGEADKENNSQKEQKDEDEDNESESGSEKTSTQKLYELQKMKSNKPISEKNKNNILKNIEDLILEIDNINDNIKELKEINELICDGDEIITSNHSQQVAEILIENAKTKKFKVFVAESAPLLDGRIQAEILSQKGINTTIFNDDDIFSLMTKMPKVKVLLGARAILVNGGLITYGGSYNICLSAHMFSIPVIIAGGSTKLTPMHSFKHDLYNEHLSPDLIFGKNVKYKLVISNIQFNNPAFDYVPPNLITMYATNIGIINPNYLYRLLDDMYDKEDYEI